MKNSRPKTLVIISPGFPKNEADTACIPPQQLFVKALKEADPQLNIIVLTLEYPFFSAGYLWNGIKVISFGRKNYKSLFFRLRINLRVGIALKKINKEFEITGLLSFWFGRCAYIGYRFAKRNKLPHYCWLLGQDAKAGNKYVKKIKPNGGSLIALSDFIATEFNKNYSVLPQHIIPPGVDTALFGAAKLERDIDILGAGSLIPLKQYPVFLEMMLSLKEFFPGITAVICGDGPDMAPLRAKAASMELESNLTFAGKLPHTEVLALMQRSKILLHTSKYEGFGAVCLEALYGGAHVVSFVRPMNTPIKNWHIAKDRQEMLAILTEKLQAQSLDHEPVLPYTIQHNAKAFLQLLDGATFNTIEA